MARHAAPSGDASRNRATRSSVIVVQPVNASGRNERICADSLAWAALGNALAPDGIPFPDRVGRSIERGGTRPSGVDDSGEHCDHQPPVSLGGSGGLGSLASCAGDGLEQRPAGGPARRNRAEQRAIAAFTGYVGERRAECLSGPDEPGHVLQVVSELDR